MAKVAIWYSDFQVNRLRLCEQLYVNIKFVTVPGFYCQLITIAIRDLNSKDEEVYHLFFRFIKDIMTSLGKIEWNLEFMTMDFEIALLEGAKRAFPDVYDIGCLFYLSKPFLGKLKDLD